MVVAAGVVWPYEFGRSGSLYIYVSYDFDACVTRTIYSIKSLYFVSCYCMYVYSFYVSLYYFFFYFTRYSLPSHVRVMCESGASQMRVVYLTCVRNKDPHRNLPQSASTEHYSSHWTDDGDSNNPRENTRIQYFGITHYQHYNNY